MVDNTDLWTQGRRKFRVVNAMHCILTVKSITFLISYSPAAIVRLLVTLRRLTITTFVNSSCILRYHSETCELFLCRCGKLNEIEKNKRVGGSNRI